MTDVDEMNATPAGDSGADPVARLARAYLDHPSPQRLRELMAEHAAAADQLVDAFFDGGGAAGVSEVEEVVDPEKIGPYRRLGILGRGGQAVVFLAEDTRLRRRVALKVLVGLDILGATAALERFEREARTASRLTHPNLCEIYDTGIHEGMAFIAMRYVEGQSLAALIESGRSDAGYTLAWPEASDKDESTSSKAGISWSSLERTLAFFETAARALHAAHQAGVIHRDVKAGNIMVTPGAQPVIVDFGLARDDDSGDPSLTRTGDVLGTPSYMSPEQFRGEHLDRRTDVYSLGIALYHTLCGDVPYRAATPVELHREVSEGRIPDVTRGHPNCPPELGVVVCTAVDPDRDRRYGTAEAFAEDLRCVRCRIPIAAQAPGILLRLKRWSQRNPVLAVAIVILTLAGTIAWTGWWRAAQNNQDFMRLYDRFVAAEHVDEANDELWPPWPELVGAMHQWTERVDTLLRGRKAHQSTLARLEERAVPTVQKVDAQYLAAVQRVRDGYQARVEALKKRSANGEKLQSTQTQLAAANRTLSKLQQPTLHLKSKMDRFFRDGLKEMLEDMAKLEPAKKAIANRIKMATEIRSLSIGAHSEAWQQAIDAVTADKRFSGWSLKPQIGLVPIGEDPRTHLQEFAHLRSGSIPSRAAEGGLVLSDDFGIVFVLLPPCSAEQSLTKTGLDPFFVAKFELTRAQYTRLLPDGPRSKYRNGRNGKPINGKRFSFTITPRHPMGSVTWHTATRLAKRWGLSLPTRAQWSYAARAGLSREAETQSWAKTANLYDQSAAKCGAAFNRAKPAPWSDGHVFATPVGTLQANPFGLHDMIGNHWEWCCDRAVELSTAGTIRGTGQMVALDGDKTDVIIVGGSYFYAETLASSWLATEVQPQNTSTSHGMRLARRIRP